MTPLLPAFYFGSVEHYAMIARHPWVSIDVGEHFVRQSYRTRTAIMGPNGKQELTVQIDRRSGEKMPMHTVGLSYSETWPQQHVHAIRSAYGQSPWYIHYMDEIASVLGKRYDKLVELELTTMRMALKWLDIGTELRISEDHVNVEPGHSEPGPGNETYWDLRSSLHPKKPLPPGMPVIAPYPQVFADRHGHIERLSVIDLVMNTGPEAGAIVRRA